MKNIKNVLNYTTRIGLLFALICLFNGYGYLMFLAGDVSFLGAWVGVISYFTNEIITYLNNK
jgi:hypothetical protein